MLGWERPKLCFHTLLKWNVICWRRIRDIAAARTKENCFGHPTSESILMVVQTTLIKWITSNISPLSRPSSKTSVSTKLFEKIFQWSSLQLVSFSMPISTNRTYFNNLNKDSIYYIGCEEYIFTLAYPQISVEHNHVFGTHPNWGDSPCKLLNDNISLSIPTRWLPARSRWKLKSNQVAIPTDETIIFCFPVPHTCVHKHISRVTFHFTQTENQHCSQPSCIPKSDFAVSKTPHWIPKMLQ